MSRRRRRDWSASGLPRLRDAWTRALSSELGRQGRGIDVARAHGDQAPAEVREAVRVYDATLPAREALIEHTSRAELYWYRADGGPRNGVRVELARLDADHRGPV